jgi:hypothetical protein
MRNFSSRNRRRSSVRGSVGVIALAVVGIVIFVAIAFGCSAARSSTETTINAATIDSKDRVCDGGQDGACKYLVFTDKGTFEVTDILFQRTNSSDVYGRIKEGKTYNLRVIGWRNGVFSSYQNILEATEVPQ